MMGIPYLLRPRWFAGALSTLITLWISGVTVAHASGPALPWATAAGHYRAEQTTTDIIVRRGEQTVFSARELVRVHDRAIRQGYSVAGESAAERAVVAIEHRFTFISLIGPFLSLRDDIEVDAKGWLSPHGKINVFVIDLRRPAQYYVDLERPFDLSSHAERIVGLKSLFSQKDLAAALASIPAVRVTLDGKVQSLPDTLHAVYTSGLPSTDCYPHSFDNLTNFSLLTVSATTVRVRLLIVGGATACRHLAKTFDLELPYRGNVTGMLPIHRPVAALPPADLPALVIQDGSPPRH